MNRVKLSIAVLATALFGSSPALATDGCGAMNHVVKTARNDFTALRSLKMQPGVCTLRSTEYKCRWTFPGDAFGTVEAQAASLVQCATIQTAEAPRKLKRGETLFALEPDLSLLVAKPEIDSGQWVIVMRILAGAAPLR